MSELTPDTEMTLTHASYALTVSPYGASLRGLTRAGKPVIAGYHGKDGKVGGQGDVLIPWPGRITDGRYVFEGQTYQLPLNDKEAASAIHGFLRTQTWDIARQEAHSIVFHTSITPDQHPGYPFALDVNLTYTLSEQGLAVEMAIENTGNTDAPVAAGQHPYFTVDTPLIDTDILHVPFRSMLQYKDLLTTGRVLPVEGTPFDFRQPHAIGDVPFNTCYLDPEGDGPIHIRLQSPDGPALTVWLGGACRYVVLYSGDPLPESHRRKALAIEPMSCGSNAFNEHQWGLVTLAPGETTQAVWGVTAE